VRRVDEVSDAGADLVSTLVVAAAAAVRGTGQVVVLALTPCRLDRLGMIEAVGAPRR
jgi:hypothetical protein